MASRISYRDQFFYVSNQRFNLLIDFALQIATRSATSDVEQQFASTLNAKTPNFYPGYDFAIEDEFPSRDERKFWARIFFDLSHLIFTRAIANQDVSFWQASACGDAYLLGRILTRSVQEEELGWHPKTIASLEADAFHQKGTNVRL